MFKVGLSGQLNPKIYSISVPLYYTQVFTLIKYSTKYAFGDSRWNEHLRIFRVEIANRPKLFATIPWTKDYW